MENHIHYFSDPPNKTLEIRYKRTKKLKGKRVSITESHMTFVQNFAKRK